MLGWNVRGPEEPANQTVGEGARGVRTEGQGWCHGGSSRRVVRRREGRGGAGWAGMRDKVGKVIALGEISVPRTIPPLAQQSDSEANKEALRSEPSSTARIRTSMEMHVPWTRVNISNHT